MLFGVNYVMAKVALREVSPVDLVVIRTWLTAAILLTLSKLRRRATPEPKLSLSDVGQLLLYSLLGASINQIGFLEGLARSTATNASVMFVSIPLLTLVFAVALGRERVSLTPALGVGIGLTGALLLIVPRGGMDVTSGTTVGNALLLLSSCSYALYLVLTRPILARHDPLRVVSYIFLLAALTISPFGVRGVGHLMLSGLSTAGWASVAYVVIGGTALPYLLNNWALARVKSSIVAVYVLLQPVVAGLLGRLLLHEQFAPHAALAAFLIMTGVIMSAWRRR